jgi:hypothetical protein
VFRVTGLLSTVSCSVSGEDIPFGNGIVDCETELFAIVAGVVEFCTHPEKNDSNSKQDTTPKKINITAVFLCFTEKDQPL